MISARLQDYQPVQRSLIIDLQKLADCNLLVASDVKATEHLQEGYQHLKQLHLDLEQRANQLQVCVLATMIIPTDVSTLQDRVNVFLSINDKIDDNIRQIKSKLILYESDLVRLKNEVANTVSEKRIRAETAVVRCAPSPRYQPIDRCCRQTIFHDLELVAVVIDELIGQAESECETSAENRRALTDLKSGHQLMLNEFQVKRQEELSICRQSSLQEQVLRNNLLFNEHFNHGENARTLRSFITDVTTELCNLDKQSISTVEETREFIEVNYLSRLNTDLPLVPVENLPSTAPENALRRPTGHTPPHSAIDWFGWTTETRGRESVPARGFASARNSTREHPYRLP